VGLIPHSKRCRINLDDRALDESIGSDQLVVRSIVHLFQVTITIGIAQGNNKRKDTHDTDYACLACDMFRAPCKIARIKAQGTVFEVAAADSNCVYALNPKLGVCSLATELKFSLFAVVCTLSTTCRALMS
jgi:hypothetical protein